VQPCHPVPTPAPYQYPILLPLCQRYTIFSQPKPSFMLHSHLSFPCCTPFLPSLIPTDIYIISFLVACPNLTLPFPIVPQHPTCWWIPLFCYNIFNGSDGLLNTTFYNLDYYISLYSAGLLHIPVLFSTLNLLLHCHTFHELNHVVGGRTGFTHVCPLCHSPVLSCIHSIYVCLYCGLCHYTRRFVFFPIVCPAILHCLMLEGRQVENMGLW